MNWKSTATTGVVGGTLVTLLATASPSVDRQGAAPAPAASADMQQSATLLAEADRLRERLRPQVPPLPSTRNPFAFGRAAPGSQPTPSRPPGLPTALPSFDTSTPPPTFSLVGLAEDRSTGRTIMTAILSGPGTLQFVTEGDRVDGGYLVSAITSESVELIAADGTPLLLRLK
jgi:hypothetical protein